MPSDITVVSADDWVGIYIDGWLFREDHRMSNQDWLDVLGMTMGSLYTLYTAQADEEWLFEHGNLPSKLTEVVVHERAEYTPRR